MPRVFAIERIIMKKTILFIVLIILIIFVLISISYKNNKKIVESLGVYSNKTTKSEIIEKFGKPDQVITLKSGEKWYYNTFKVKISGVDENRIYIVNFNRDNIVKNSYFLSKPTKIKKTVVQDETYKKFRRSKAYEYAKKGADYLNKGNPKHAIAEYEKSLESFPDYYLVYSNLGYAYLQSLRLNEALESFKKALSLNSNCLEAIKGMVSVYTQMGNMDEATKYLEKVIELDPDPSPSYYMSLGLMYNQQNRLKEAIPLFKKVIEANPKFSRAYFELAYDYDFLKEVDLAIENYEKGIALDPKFIPAYVRLGLCYTMKNNIGKAYDYIKEAQKLDPNNESVNSIAKTIEGKFGNAIALAEQAKKDGAHLNIVQAGNVTYVGPQYYKEGDVPTTPIEQKVFDEYNRTIKEIEAMKLSDSDSRANLYEKVKEIVKRYNITEENLTHLLLKIRYREVPPDSYKLPSEN